MSQRPAAFICCLVAFVVLTGCSNDADQDDVAAQAAAYDVIIRNGLLYDGSGAEPRQADIGIRGDRIATIGDLKYQGAATEIDAQGLAVSPGFIDLISFSWDVWPVDSRALSNVYQGVTLEVFAEGESPGPLTPELKELMKSREYVYQYDVTWTSLGDYLDYMEKRGAGANFASFIGNSNVRRAVVGESSRQPTPEELERMKDVVRAAMREGALGLGTGLTTPPGTFSSQRELTELARVVAEADGVLEVAMRSQSNKVLEALDEALQIARDANVRTHIGHIYASGKANWDKADAMIGKVKAARAAGLDVTASVYPYTEAWTYLTSVFPPWVHDGGLPKVLERLDDPQQRERIVREMQNWKGGDLGGGWEQYLVLADTPENVIFLRFKEESLKSYQGRTLADFMRDRGIAAKERAAIEVVRENRNEVSTLFRTQTETNLRKFLAQPWVSIGSDASSIATEGVHLGSPVHPRTYGSFTRLIEKFARTEGLMSLQEAIRRVTSLPATELRIADRGALKEGYFADVAVFDPAAVHEMTTFADSHQYSRGMMHVFVNGKAVLADGKHTGALPGRAVRGPGWNK
jgi:N-acyl-D-amino-acid deacylase